ncbi:MAG TPA: hypothetical protein VFO79_16665 [Xanthomonadales bacterium]|nr:hypothetical protein [Xanthomonadales bacterium]
MKSVNARWLASLLGPHVFLAITLAVSWLAPQSVLAATPDGARGIMLLESVLLLASILVGGFAPVAYTAFPLVLLATLVWLFSVGRTGFSLALVSFVWGVVAAFLEGVRANRGDFGHARENVLHPHRRYDRVVLVWLATLPVLPAAWLAGEPAWAVWGTVYFATLVLADTVLLHPIDRIPRAILKRMQRNVDPELAAKIGMCGTCMYVQPAIPPREGCWVRCGLATKDPRFDEYPKTPLAACPGHRPRD